MTPPAPPRSNREEYRALSNIYPGKTKKKTPYHLFRHATFRTP